MLDFEKLIAGPHGDSGQIENYFPDFFTRKNFKEYKIPGNAKDHSRKAIKIMFESRRELRERVEKAFAEDPLCLEAFFVYYMSSEDVYVNYRFQSYYDELNSYPDLDAYQKYCYLRILDFYVEFLLDIHNFTTAIKIQKTLIRLSNACSLRNLDRLAFSYASIEDADEFYRLYVNNDLSVYGYILLVVTLLKHEERLKASQVARELLEKEEAASYLDHLWDLDESDPKQAEFYKIVEDCYEYINGVPDFFSFFNLVREKSDGTI